MAKWQRHLYQPNIPLGENGRKVTGCEEHLRLTKEAAKEGMVLLKNEKALLPLAPGSKVVLLGKGCVDYVKSGGGSGDVVVDHVTGLLEGLKQDKSLEIYQPLADFYQQYVYDLYEKGEDPGLIAEPELTEETLSKAAEFSRLAILSISRFSGEGWDRKSTYDAGEANGDEVAGVGCLEKCNRLFPKGDFYLSEEEEKLLSQAEKYFDSIIVILNVGGVMDTSWIAKKDRITSALIIWNAGQEGGLATAEVLVGKGYPSGKLADSFAARLEDYPSTKGFHASEDYVDYTEDIYVGYRYFSTLSEAPPVVYPFGYGLSYTNFMWNIEDVTQSLSGLRIGITVYNVGAQSGKEVIQVYMKAPQGRLGKPKRVLVGFVKTPEMAPKQELRFTLDVPVERMASYDDLGAVVKSAYVLEAGTYEFYVGNSLEHCEKLPIDFKVEKDRVIEQLSPHCVPSSLEQRLKADGSYETLPQTKANDPRSSEIDWDIPVSAAGAQPDVVALPGRDLFRHPYSEDYVQLIDVAEGRLRPEEFVKGMSDEDLRILLGGQQNLGIGVTFGIGNNRKYGIPNVMTADGPAGLRVNPDMGVYTTAWPCATALACSFNTEVVYAVGEAAAKEVKENNVGVWLAPAVNIHRSPLCGRNFEYYSEDPFLAGKIGAAMVKGVQSQNIAATIKHFACNNKETNRINSDSRVSERALREIYLKQFEIIVKEAKPWCVMTSYNILNGHRTSECKELITDILRGEWGYDGLVMTDWWNQGNHYKEVKAGNDVKMAIGFPKNLLMAQENGVLRREEMEACATNIVKLICRLD